MRPDDTFAVDSKGMLFAIGLYTSGPASNAFDVMEYIDLNVKVGGNVRIGYTNKQVKYTKCTREDVDSSLFTISESKVSKLDALNINWYCFDLSGVELYGS